MERFDNLGRMFSPAFCGGAGEAALFVFALLVLALGALSLVDEIYWRRRARRVTAEVAGAKRFDKKYYAVYRFTDPTGQVFEATSLCGKRRLSRSSAVELLVLPPEHLNFRRRRSFLRRFFVCSLLLAPWACFAAMDLRVCGGAPWKIGLALAVLLGGGLSLKRLTSPPAPPKNGGLQEQLRSLPVIPADDK